MDQNIKAGIELYLPKDNMEDSHPDAKFTDNLYVEIIKTYLDTESVKLTADTLHTTPVKVRKVLITEGLWSSKKSLEIQHYVNLGKTTAEIADILSTTEKAVQQYLPYTKGLYNGDDPSVAAVNSADYRERIRVAQEKTLKRSFDLAMKSQWNEMYETSRMANYSKIHHEVNPIRLHLELVRKDDYFGLNGEAAKEYRKKEAEETSRVLKTYGEVKYGDTISRDVIVPGNMPLWALNYVIQKCFGWQNSHLHQFELPEEQFQRVTNGKSEYFMNLVGVAFRSPWMEEDEEFWNDDYEDGSFKTWLRKKYTWPYESMCHGEGIWQCRQDMKEMKKRFAYVEVEHCYRKAGKQESLEWVKSLGWSKRKVSNKNLL